jgi:hypothetical protein
LCPGLDVPVRVASADEPEVVITGDWQTIPANELIARIQLVDPETITADQALAGFVENIRPIHDSDGTLAARLAVYPYGEFFGDAGYPGVVSTAGLYGDSLLGLMGLMRGRPASVTR